MTRTPRGLDRREALALGLGAFVIAAVPLAAGSRPRLVRRAVPLMGTVAEIAVVHRDETLAHAAIDEAIEALRRVDRLMTRFVADSDIGRANARAATQAVPVSRATATVLRDALAWAEASDGRFDPCVGRAIRLWDVGHRTAPPPERDVRRLAGRRLYRALDIAKASPDGAVVRFASADVALDLGGIAKGYGVDLAADALRAGGVRQGIINVGGDLYALGEPEPGAPWRVGIRAPDDPARMVDTVEVRDAAVATSGDYLQYFLHRGRRYHHILDPGTGQPHQTPMRSVTVVAPTCLTADAAATTVFGMAEERARPLLRARAPGARLAHSLSGSADA